MKSLVTRAKSGGRVLLLGGLQLCLMAAYAVLAVFIPLLPWHWSVLAELLWFLLLALLYFSCHLKRWQRLRRPAAVLGAAGCISAAAMCILLLAGHIVLDGTLEHTEKKEQGVQPAWREEPLICYISGIEGKKALTGKKKRYSDVNLLAVVNPFSHEILLVNTPRDTLLTVPGTEGEGAAGEPEKLDAMMLYGKDAPQKALEELYGIAVDGMVRVNYAAFEEIVDALGGVCVYSEMAFESDWGPVFLEGDNDVDGRAALAFVRERHHLPEGDIQRGRNQQYMVAAILDKLRQTKSLSVYQEILGIVKKRVGTNISVRSLEELLQWQLEDSGQWRVENYTIAGEQASAVTNSSKGQEIYAFLPDEASVQKAKQKIEKSLSYTSGD